MRSLTLKLTVAFLLVGLIGAILVALIIGQRTRSEFDRFRDEQDQAVLIATLERYYAEHGTWQGVEAVFAATSTELYRHLIVIADADGRVVVGNPFWEPGLTLPPGALAGSTPLIVADRVVGTVLLATPPSRPANEPGAPSPEQRFLERISQVAGLSAAIAGVLALVMGMLLARTLTRPIRELTTATRLLANDEFDHQVPVRSNDEIGELSRSFNQMSTNLARARHLRQQMTADLAHDLRTPLTILRGYTEGLKDGRLSGEPALYQIMHGEVEHLQRLVEDLRLLSLADSGNLSLNRRPVDPAALLERAALAHMVQAEQQGVRLRVTAAEQLPSVGVDTDRMAQVLNNLVANALRHTTPGEITLAAVQHDNQVILSVGDNGSGIAAEDLPYVFERFYRADKARQRSDSTTSGLGLAIARAIVEAHGGRIEVVSIAGQGTTFTIALPVAYGQVQHG
ncbi:MAG TPA: ATP-binding protein [Roseiflexaceae bacterium]|nr:ATP-binding protein [Roseiflexaceae bacterium]HMP41327.1 ATP-binding protein [Roseiflexaceae bacterium]